MPDSVFLFDRDGDLNVFKTQAQAEGWMEAIDVRNGEYVVAYRADGTCLVPTTDGQQVVLVPTEQTEQTEHQNLEDRLQDYAARVPTAPRATNPETFAREWLAPRSRSRFRRGLAPGESR